MESVVFLIRHGVTPWHDEGKVLGQRDMPLSERGLSQSQAAANSLGSVQISDVVSSPLQRSIQAAEIIGKANGIEVARDPRLTDFRVGKWSGMPYQEIATSPEYLRFIDNPLSERIPGGESLAEIRDRSVAAVEQALVDSPTGDAIVIVTHAGIIRVILSHYLGSNPANYHRIRVSPGSISVLSFAAEGELPRVLAVNHRPSLSEVLS
ncbi:MAG: histidine phosphatase family protein [Deltaproteobacteria bacterium]|nr:histidine phosphatase family protein [Deltaproteobacteria bacterium]